MTFNDVIEAINYKVENSNFARFGLAQIITEMNNTYRDLANKTSLFETHDYMPLAENKVEYTLPNRIERPTRAIYRGEKIEFVSQEDMDLHFPKWESELTEAELKFLVYNNLSDRLVKPYPILTDTQLHPALSDLLLLGELSNTSNEYISYLYLHTPTGAKFTADKPLGTVAGYSLTEVVTVYGAYIPERVKESNLDSSDLFMSEINVNALIYGTAGNLLISSGRTENIEKGKSYLQMYGLDETEVQAIKKKDFTGGFRNTAKTDRYRTPFDR